jgi:hypothetical protein
MCIFPFFQTLINIKTNNKKTKNQNEMKHKMAQKVSNHHAEAILTITNAIQRLEDKKDKSTYEKIKLRNLRRMITLQSGHAFCPRDKRELFEDDLFSCMVCKFGHISECHHPFDCYSAFCNHYSLSCEQEKLNLLIRKMKGTPLENIPKIKNFLETLEDARRMGFYCDDINEFYNYLSDPDNYRELLKFSKSFNKNTK